MLQHTREVIDIAIHNNRLLKIGLSEIDIFLTGLYHDYGKIYEYELVKESEEKQYWKETKDKKLIYHIARSALFWQEINDKYFERYPNYEDVLHAILAHHGRREWKSVVEPQTKLAWLIHTADYTSARLNDEGHKQ